MSAVEKKDHPVIKTASLSAHKGKQQVYKDTQKSKLIIPKKTFDTSSANVLRKIDQRDRAQTSIKVYTNKEQKPLTSTPDSLWNIYTGIRDITALKAILLVLAM